MSLSLEILILDTVGPWVQGGPAPSAPVPSRLGWSEQNVWGVMPSSVCEDNSAKDIVDLRGNNLLGRPPPCLWETHGAEHLLLSRNNFVGTLGRLSPMVRVVHVGFNRLSGDVGDVFGAALGDFAATGGTRLQRIVAHGNRFTSTTGIGALSAASPVAAAATLKLVDLSSNSLGPAGSLKLAAHLGALSSLHSYDIGGNLWDHHVAALGAAGGAHPVGVHVDVTLRPPSHDEASRKGVLTALCGACPGLDLALTDRFAAGGGNLVSLLRHCVKTSGCTAKNVDGSDKDPMNGQRIDASNAPKGIASIECALHTALAKSSDDADAAAYEYDVELVEIAQAPESARRDFNAAFLADSSSNGTFSSGHKSEEVQQDDGHGVRLAFTVKARSTRSPGAATGEDAIDVSVAVRAAVASIDAAVASGELSALALSRRCGGDARRLGPVTAVAQAACPTGRLGAKCDYVCTTSWRRTGSHAFHLDPNAEFNDVTSGALGLSIDAVAATEAGVEVNATEDAGVDAELEEDAEEEEEETEQTGIDVAQQQHHHRDQQQQPRTESGLPHCTHLRAARGKCVYVDHANPAVHYNFVGHETNTAHHTLHYHLPACTSGCRAHVHLAVHECYIWLHDKSVSSQHMKCRGMLRDVISMCGVAGVGDLWSCADQSYADDNGGGCRVCGVVKHFVQHGVTQKVGFRVIPSPNSSRHHHVFHHFFLPVFLRT